MLKIQHYNNKDKNLLCSHGQQKQLNGRINKP